MNFLRARAHTNTHTHDEERKTETAYSVAGEGVTKRAARVDLSARFVAT